MQQSETSKLIGGPDSGSCIEEALKIELLDRLEMSVGQTSENRIKDISYKRVMY